MGEYRLRLVGVFGRLVGLFILGPSKSSVGEQCLLDLLEFAALMQAVGIIVGVVVALLQIRDINKTRKADLFMDLYATFKSKEHARDYLEILFKHSWRDFDDWMEKYGPDRNLEAMSLWISVPSYFEGVGILLRKKMIDIALVDDLLSSEILMLWEKIAPVVKEYRARMNRPQLWEYFEYLYEQMKQREQKLSSRQEES